jgi:hypothetical protein
MHLMSLDLKLDWFFNSSFFDKSLKILYRHDTIQLEINFYQRGDFANCEKC